MAEYKLISPAAIHIKGMQPTDIRGLHSLLKQEGCIDSENLFSDKEKDPLICQNDKLFLKPSGRSDNCKRSDH